MPQRQSAQGMASQIETSMAFVHRANIERYKWLLTKSLNEGDRIQIERHLAKEQASLLKLTER